MTHTPGPWTFHTDDNFNYNIESTDCVLAEISGMVDDDAANARLMAAGPTLLEALEMVRDADQDVKSEGRIGMPPSPRAKIDAAILLARGE